MTLILDLPPETEAQLIAAAAAAGQDVNTYAAAALAEVAARNQKTPPPVMLAETLAGRIGGFRSRPNTNLSEHTGERFADGMEQKRRDSRL